MFMKYSPITVYEPRSVIEEWERRISSEFGAQASRELALGLPVAPFMVNLDDPQHRAKLQVFRRVMVVFRRVMVVF